MKWISVEDLSVEDRFPEAGAVEGTSRKCLVVTKDGDFYIARKRINISRHWYAGDGSLVYDVTHWALPEPPDEPTYAVSYYRKDWGQLTSTTITTGLTLEDARALCGRAGNIIEGSFLGYEKEKRC